GHYPRWKPPVLLGQHGGGLSLGKRPQGDCGSRDCHNRHVSEDSLAERNASGIVQYQERSDARYHRATALSKTLGQSISRRWCLGFLTGGAAFAQGVSTRAMKPALRGKPSGLPFDCHFTDIAAQAGLTSPVIYGG